MEKIYLDNAATTAVATEVVRAMNEHFKQDYFNPSAKYGEAENTLDAVEHARKIIADKIGAKASEIIFTSGGTESNNIAIQGIVRANPLKKHIIVSQIEHPSVLEICRELEKQDFEIDYVGVDENGVVDVEAVRRLLCENTLLVSVMHVNNETGAIAPIKEIGNLCRENDIYFHTDAVQSFAKLPIDVTNQNIDLLSASGHKINGPKGVGVMYVKQGTKITPLLHGGEHEFKKRAGTENIPGIIGFASAVKHAPTKKEIEKMSELRDKLIDGILKIEATKLNGSKGENRLCNNINVSFAGIEGEAIGGYLDQKFIADILYI